MKNGVIRSFGSSVVNELVTLFDSVNVPVTS